MFLFYCSFKLNKKNEKKKEKTKRECNKKKKRKKQNGAKIAEYQEMDISINFKCHA